MDNNLLISYLHSFGQLINSNPGIRDQKDIVNEFNTQQSIQHNNDVRNQYQDNLNKSQPNNEEINKIMENGKTGDKYEVNIKKNESLSDRKKQQILQRELTITFTSLNDNNKIISSSLDNLCNGKYSSLKSSNLNKIAEEIEKDLNYIISFNDACIANNSVLIGPIQALKLAKSISDNRGISYFDYEKINSKLPKENSDRFNNLLKSAGIKIYYPQHALEQNKKINYYVSFIKDFQEYKVGNINGLKKRVASILPIIDKNIKDRFIDEMKKDDILKQTI
jgi:hypothetical protein